MFFGLSFLLFNSITYNTSTAWTYCNCIRSFTLYCIYVSVQHTVYLYFYTYGTNIWNYLFNASTCLFDRRVFLFLVFLVNLTSCIPVCGWYRSSQQPGQLLHLAPPPPPSPSLAFDTDVADPTCCDSVAVHVVQVGGVAALSVFNQLSIPSNFSVHFYHLFDIVLFFYIHYTVYTYFFSFFLFFFCLL